MSIMTIFMINYRFIVLLPKTLVTWKIRGIDTIRIVTDRVMIMLDFK